MPGSFQPFASADPKARVLELVARRGKVYERITPYRQAAEAHWRRSDTRW